jgi:hypothetical protein
VRFAFVVLGIFGMVALGACGRVYEPSNKPVDACVHSCERRASRQCSDDECRRGCEFILDRLVEKEQDNVVACVAKNARRCTDVVWADCAVRVGVHADGGPPAPPPPPEDWE